MSSFAEVIAQLIRDTREANAEYEHIYQVLRKHRKLDEVTVAKMHCPKKGCSLGVVMKLGDIFVARAQPFKLSPFELENKTSVSARKKRQNDQGYWNPVTFAIDPDWGDDASVRVRCHHTEISMTFKEIYEIVKVVEPGNPIHLPHAT